MCRHLRLYVLSYGAPGCSFLTRKMNSNTWKVHAWQEIHEAAMSFYKRNGLKQNSLGGWVFSQQCRVYFLRVIN